ncbi:MAG TPA: DUF4129 domain-containing protein [Gaiellaceae bacterium]|nr:DUF4129 domain-containing protein [Gaiellaceae bacterium]
MNRSRLVPLALAVTLLLAVVAIAARGRPLGSGGSGKGGVPLAFWDYLFTTLVIVGVVLLLALGVAALFVRKAPGKPRSFFQQRMILTIAAFVLFAMFGSILARHHFFAHLHLAQQQGRLNPRTTLPRGRSVADTRSPQLRWDEIAIVLGVLLVVAAIYGVLSSRREPRLFRPRPEDTDALVSALDLSLDDLRTDPDLRRAIIAAYARMEAALGAAGIRRRPSEAPLEYLERALLTLHASAEAVRTLTDLFEWARFSHHEPEPSMRDEAVDALVAVRDELRASELIPA